MPEFNMEHFLSGDFTKEFEKYLSDQFVKKEFWTGLKASAEKLTLSQENNGVYFGKDGYLFERFDKSEKQLNENIESLKFFAEKADGMSTYFALIPTSVEIYPENLPLFAQTDSQEELIDEVKEKVDKSFKLVDVYSPLMESKEEYIYFRTDHHWTMRGAYYAYRETAKAMGFNPYEMDDFTVDTVSKDFFGTFYSKASDHSIAPDSIEVFKPKADIVYNVEYDNNGKKTSSLYNLDYTSKKDQYSLFLDGNHSKVKITSSVKNNRKLVVIKDSYAHAFVPFLANHFEEVHILDLRYFHADLYSYLKENKIDDVLFLYNAVNFSKDPNMIWLRR